MNYNEVIFTTFQKLIKDKEITPLFYKNKDIIMKQTALFDVNETFYWEE